MSEYRHYRVVKTMLQERYTVVEVVASSEAEATILVDRMDNDGVLTDWDDGNWYTVNEVPELQEYGVEEQGPASREDYEGFLEDAGLEALEVGDG